MSAPDEEDRKVSKKSSSDLPKPPRTEAWRAAQEYAEAQWKLIEKLRKLMH